MKLQKHETTRQLGAVVKYEVDQNYTRKSADFTNGGGEAVQLQPGVLFTGGDTPVVFDTAAAEDVTGICLSTESVDPGETVLIVWLSDGPAIVNANEVDFPEDAAQRTAIEVALTAKGIKLVNGLDV